MGGVERLEAAVERLVVLVHVQVDHLGLELDRQVVIDDQLHRLLVALLRYVRYNNPPHTNN